MGDEQVHGVISSLLGQAEFAERESLRTGNASLSMLYRVQAKAIENVLADRDRLAAELAEFKAQTGALGDRLMRERDEALAEVERIRLVVDAARTFAARYASGFDSDGPEMARARIGIVRSVAALSPTAADKGES